MILYQLLDKFFFVFHSFVILFNLFGWIWRKTRRWNLALILLTAGSWTLLGIRYGFGYCPCTDWHWQVRIKLGLVDLPHSYLKFLFDTLTGLDIRPGLMDTMAFSGLGAAFVLSLILNVRDRQKKRRSGERLAIRE